jgi:opacity protein-like surface antigen
MKLARTLGVLFASAAMASVSAPAVYAQGEGGAGAGVYGGGSVGATWMRAGSAPRKVGTESCPGVMWDIVRSAGPDKNTIVLSGPVWNLDGSGTSMAKGEAHADGTFNMTLTSIQGNGPAGQVTGNRNRSGVGHATLTGSGTCNNMSIPLKAGQTSTKG